MTHIGRASAKASTHHVRRGGIVADEVALAEARLHIAQVADFQVHRPTKCLSRGERQAQLEGLEGRASWERKLARYGDSHNHSMQHGLPLLIM